jgi:hypothetical protein
MYESVPMDLAERRRQADRDAQGAGQIERLSLASLKNQIQRIAARVFEYEDRSPFVTSERQRLGCPCGIDFGCERVFVFQPPETLRRRILCRHSHYKYGRLGAFLPTTVKGEFHTFPQRYELVPRRDCPGKYHLRHG